MTCNLIHAIQTLAIALLLLSGCATSPTGRSQLQIFPDEEMAQMGEAAFQKMRQETPVATDPALREYVQCIVEALSVAIPPPEGEGRWQVTVFREENPNAFALPGGYIGVHTGMLDRARTPAQLAAVIAHEIGHLEADHPNARLSTQFATQTGMQLAAALLGSETTNSQQIMSLLGVGAQVGVVLPFSRSQETEADILGLRYMAQAGFDPREAVVLWQNMMQAGGGSPPAFLSTHPTNQARIETLQEDLPEALRIFRQAREAGRNPDCNQPR